MNSLSTSAPFLGLGGKPPAASGNSPLLSASANDVAASFSELLRGSGAKPAAMTPPVEPPPPAQQAPSRPVTPPKADAGPTQAQAQAKVDRANSQDRETLARQSQARSAQARSEAAAGRNAERVAKPETAAFKDGKAVAEGKDSIDNPASAPAETEIEQTAAQPTDPAVAASLTALPIDIKTIKISATEDGKTDARSASAKSGKAQLAEIGGHAAAGAAADVTASAADASARDSTAAAGVTLEGLQASAKPAASGSAGNATLSFEAMMNAAQTQQAKGGIDASGPSTASAPAARLELAQPLHSPAFGPEMAARLSLLAADGVQQAQLHLNPAEMGPVSVQIVVEGQQAQISFHSDQADTRAVLENSLPELAAALRESGLTLSGGGVFQQARNPEEQPQPADGRSAVRADRSAEDGAVPVSTPARTTASRGVLDLYA